MVDRDDATQDPSAGRLRRAEQSGQFARSREFTVAISWLAGIALLTTFGSLLWQALSQFSVSSWAGSNIGVSGNELLASNLAAAQAIFWNGLVPILGGVAVIAAVTWWAQSGFRFFPKLAAPDASRISPRKNLGRVFGSENLISVSLGLFKFLALLVVSGWILIGDWQSLMGLGQGHLASESKQMVDWLTSVVQRLCLAAAFVGLADFGIRWQLNRRALRMTDQEVRDEQRSMEASPEVSARRRLMRQR